MKGFWGRTARKIFLTKPVRKALLFAPVKLVFEEVSQIYAQARVQEKLDAFEGQQAIHKTFQTGVLDTDCDFHFDDGEALGKVAQMILKDGVTIVEVGSWKGYSTSILARMASDFHGSVFAIDHWQGSAGVPHHDNAKTQDIFSVFKRNMVGLGVWDWVHPMVMDSQTAARVFADNSLDMVFIDADHRYQYVKKDISSWLPKLKNGGILSGHDCEGYYSKYPEETRRAIDERREEDTVDNKYHGGIIRALYDCFDDKYSKMPNSTIWYYAKGT